MLYLGRISIPDAFIAIKHRGKSYAVLNALEFGRAKKQSAFDEVLPLEAYTKRLRDGDPSLKVTPAHIIATLAVDLGIESFVVPEQFPAGVLDRARALGLRIEVATAAIFPSREIKTPDELKAIRRGNACSAIGIAAAESVLRASKIRGQRLYYRNEVLTSERLKFAIEVACLEAGAVSANTIAAGGDQACDPHERGHGPLKPHQLIIVDVFPRVNNTGYHGDMTRTFLKGRASEAQRALVAAVRDAQKAAVAKITAGVNGRDVHQACVALFNARGFETKHSPSGSVGFFHGTGHGLGLAVHELPRLSGSIDYTLPENSVATVEPGLYYPGLGGCRIEDVVQVTKTKPRLLSRAPYDWEIR